MATAARRTWGITPSSATRRSPMTTAGARGLGERGGAANLDYKAFVGNTTLAYDYGGDEAHEEEEIVAYSLRDLANFGGDTPSFVKIDCEGGEWAVLSDPLVAEIPIITGEWHNVRGHTRDEFTALLPSHEVMYSGPVGGPGGFRAVRR